MTETDHTKAGPDQGDLSFEDSQISALYQQASKGEPAQALDEAILAASRKAVKSGSVAKQHAAGPFSNRWPTRLAVAATLIIAVIIVPDLFQQSAKQADFPRPDTTLEAAREQPGIETSQPAVMDRAMPVPQPPAAPSATAQSGRKKSPPVKYFSIQMDSTPAKKAPRAATAARPLLRKKRSLAPSSRKQLSTSAFAKKSPGPVRSGSELYPSARAPIRDVPAYGSISGLAQRLATGAENQKTGSRTNDLKNIETDFETIRQLIRTGEMTAARELVRRFVRIYPDYPLPKDIESIFPSADTK